MTGSRIVPLRLVAYSTGSAGPAAIYSTGTAAATRRRARGRRCAS